MRYNLIIVSVKTECEDSKGKTTVELMSSKNEYGAKIKRVFNGIRDYNLLEKLRLQITAGERHYLTTGKKITYNGELISPKQMDKLIIR